MSLLSVVKTAVGLPPIKGWKSLYEHIDPSETVFMVCVCGGVLSNMGADLEKTWVNLVGLALGSRVSWTPKKAKKRGGFIVFSMDYT